MIVVSQSRAALEKAFQIEILFDGFTSKMNFRGTLNYLLFNFQLVIGEFTFSCQQLKTCIKLGYVFTGPLRFLTKNVDLGINTLPRFEVNG